MLLDDIKAQIITALKAHDQVRLETLRFLLSAVRNAAIDTYGAAGEASMTDNDVLDVIKKQVKSHKESVAAFTNGNRPELAQAETAQLAILETYLPKQLSDEELKALLAPVVASGEANFGLLMKAAMAAVSGRADGARVSTMLKQIMQKST